MKLSKIEQETIIKGNAADDKWEIVTADPKIKRLMEKRGWEQDDRVNPWGYVSYWVPYKAVSIRTKESMSRGLTGNARNNIYKAISARRSKQESMGKFVNPGDAGNDIM